MPFFHHRTAHLDAFGVLHHIYRCRFFILDEESILALILRLENPACPGHAGVLKIKQEKTKSLKEKSQRLKKDESVKNEDLTPMSFLPPMSFQIYFL